MIQTSNLVMEHLDSDTVNLILRYVSVLVKTRIKYVPYGDGEQNLSIFYKDACLFKQVCKNWNVYFV